MTFKSRDLRLVAAILVAAMLESGCTLVGLGIGALQDSDARPTTIPGWEVGKLKPGELVTLLLDGSTELTGIYVGLFGSELHVDTPAGTRERVRVSQVAGIRLPARKDGKKVMTLFGAAIDVILLFVAASQLATPEGEEFCSPLVSGFDGRRYVPEVDAFSGAMFERARYTDWAAMPAVRPASGEYRLKIEKGRAETEFIDEIRLVVVDHPTGARVRPDPSGTLRTLGNPAAPAAARSLDGMNVLDLVTKADGDFWVSSPFGRDPDDTSTVRDGLVVEFPRPPGSRSVKLLVRAQNTSWAYHLRSEFLGLLGRDFESWHAGIESSAESYRAFRDASLREVMLTVAVWDGGDWRAAGSVWEAGAAIPRDVVVPLQVPELAGDRLRVRLDATAGLWKVDSVEADFAPDLTVRSREVAPSRARDEGGRDIRALLARADGAAHVMRGDTSTAEVVFLAPPPVAGLDRTVVLKATGHYLFDVDRPDGEPQRALVERFQKEPGAWGQYSLRLLQARVERILAEQAAAR